MGLTPAAVIVMVVDYTGGVGDAGAFDPPQPARTPAHTIRTDQRYRRSRDVTPIILNGAPSACLAGPADAGPVLYHRIVIVPFSAAFSGSL